MEIGLEVIARRRIGEEGDADVRVVAHLEHIPLRRLTLERENEARE